MEIAWVLLLVQLPSEPSRHRVAVWWQLRKAGAVQCLDRLRRWYRELKKRDVLRLPDAVAAEQRLHACERVLDGYSEQVYQAMRSNTSAIDTPPASAGTRAVG
jgi:hypothetical protein